jgi:hypothetical protein
MISTGVRLFETVTASGDVLAAYERAGERQSTDRLAER